MNKKEGNTGTNIKGKTRADKEERNINVHKKKDNIDVDQRKCNMGVDKKSNSGISRRR